MAVDVEDLYRKYGPMVLRRCRTLLKDEHKALDGMQETFVKLLRYKDKLNQDAPSSLLYRMATNVCLNMIRSESRKKETGDDSLLDLIASSEDVEQKTWVKDLLDQIFSNEKASTKEIAVFYYIDRMTHEQVAKEVGLSVSGVRKRLRTLKARLKEREEELL